MLWGRRELLETLDVPKLEPAPDWSPERLETGTLSHEAIVGAAAAVDFLASLAAAPGLGRRAALAAAFGELHARGQALFERLWDGLGAIRGVTRYGPPPGRAAHADGLLRGRGAARPTRSPRPWLAARVFARAATSTR